MHELNISKELCVSALSELWLMHILGLFVEICLKITDSFSIPCQWIFLLINFIVNNQEKFQVVL